MAKLINLVRVSESQFSKFIGPCGPWEDRTSKGFSEKYIHVRFSSLKLIFSKHATPFGSGHDLKLAHARLSSENIFRAPVRHFGGFRGKTYTHTHTHTWELVDTIFRIWEGELIGHTNSHLGQFWENYGLDWPISCDQNGLNCLRLRLSAGARKKKCIRESAHLTNVY